MEAKKSIYSPLWARIFVIVLLAGLALCIWYAMVFYQTVANGPRAEAYSEFMAFRSRFFTILPFYLVLLIFSTAFWIYSLFVDFNNLYRNFDYRPGNAAFYASVPILNIYGLGWALTRIVRIFEDERLRVAHRKDIYPLKVAVAFLYAGIFGLVVSIYFAVNLPLSRATLFMPEYIGFTAIELLLLIYTLSMMVITVWTMRRVLRVGLENSLA